MPCQEDRKAHGARGQVPPTNRHYFVQLIILAAVPLMRSSKQVANSQIRGNQGHLMSSLRTPLPFHVVDVFAIEPLTGNPLAVVVGGDDLSPELLKSIAREFNQSETTFLMRPTRPKADWRLRSFTAAGVEVFGAGHNALGAWWWLAEAGKLQLQPGETVFHQEIGAQVLPVMVSARGGALDYVIMDQEAPQFRKRVEDPAPLAAALGLQSSDLEVHRIPAQVVFTGAPHLMVPIRDREAVDRVTADSKALFAVLAAAGGEGCYVFSLDPRYSGANAYARFFNPTVGIWEDPATGTAAGPLAAHLVAHGLAKQGEPILIEQGTAMGRTSLIRAEVQPDTVRISGRGVVVASGQLML
jgi:trans-2,3-dihydro-3-hydroxyanthranilate isomerase